MHKIPAAKDSAEFLLSFFPDIPLDLDTFLEQRSRMQEALWLTVPLLPGVHKLVHHLKKHNVPIAVATGTSRRSYNLKTAHLQSLFDCFEGKVVCGDDKKNMKSKPAPDIFITAAREMLNRDVGHPEISETDTHILERGKGLVFEDGLPGVQAGKRAGMSGMSPMLFLNNFSICCKTFL
jgi:pseudouridine 5'-phosphatase